MLIMKNRKVTTEENEYLVFSDESKQYYRKTMTPVQAGSLAKLFDMRLVSPFEAMSKINTYTVVDESKFEFPLPF